MHLTIFNEYDLTKISNLKPIIEWIW
jgi:hypothetical protein